MGERLALQLSAPAGTPQSGDTAVLMTTKMTVDCPLRTSCAEFIGVSAGRSLVDWVAGGGCLGGEPCVQAAHFDLNVIVEST
jgi:hypothetical protein